MAIYIAIAVLVGLLAIVSLAAMGIGLLGAAGLLRLERCLHCGHLAVATRNETPQSCPYCRHTHLVHPLAALHRSGHPHH
ncbi:MAG: hypothetical protein ACRDVG_15900 [Jatrophihabitantaceae bacterium]